MTTWSHANKLALNTDKTAALIFSNRLPYVNFNTRLRLNSVDVDYLGCHKFLGLNLDSELKFKSHIEFVSSKLSKSVGIIYKVSKLLSQKSLINLYYSLFYPYLSYCNILWCGTYNVHLNTVEMLQKKVIRIITGSEYLAHTNDLFLKAKILKLSDLHEYLLLLYFFKNKNKFSYSDGHYWTRHSGDPIITRHRLTLTEHSVHYSATRLWRNLPSHIKNITSYGSFKSILKAHILRSYESS